MTYSREIHHKGLKRARVLCGPDPHRVERLARAQIKTWNRQWEALRQDEGKTGSSGGPQSTEEGHRMAASLTKEALRALQDLGRIFPGGLRPGAGPSLKLEPFPEPPPEEPDPPDPTPLPMTDENPVQARPGLLDRILPVHRRSRDEEAAERFEAAWAEWDTKEAEAQKRDQYEARFRAWDRRRIAFETQQQRLLDARRALASCVDPEGAGDILEHVSTLLWATPFPRCLPRETSLTYDVRSRTLLLSTRLPALSDIPTLFRVTFRDDEGDFLEEHLSEQDHRVLYDSVVYQSALRIVQEVLLSGADQALQSVKLNGWADAVDPAIGLSTRVNLLTLEARRGCFDTVDPSHVSPEACFKAMGGVCGGRPHEGLAVPPLLAQEKEPEVQATGHDSRNLNAETPDLLKSPVRNFQDQMEGLLEREFLPQGWDLQITVAREDGSMEAAARPTDSRRGPNLLFHVVRSVLPVGKDEVRSLLARMASERIGRGVLLATAPFTSEARELAEQRSVSLFDGVAVEKLLRGAEPPPRPGIGPYLEDGGYTGTHPQ